MSSRSRVFRSTTFRLTARYSLIFISSALILFLLAYSLLSEAVREGDRVAMTQKLREYASLSQKKGLAGLLEFIRLERENYDYDEYYLRINGPDGKRLLDLAPPEQPALPDRLPADPPGPSVQWFFLDESGNDALVEMACRSLPAGGAVYMGKDASDREQLLRQFRVIFAGIMAPVALIGLAAGFVMARRMLKPIQDLIDTVRVIDTGRMDARVPDEGVDDELTELARLFNAMLDKIKSLISGMREALDNVAHDLCTPATRTLAAVEVAASTKNEPEELREALLDCAEETRRMVSMLGILMDISEAETGAMRLHLGPADMAELIAETADLYQYAAEEAGLALAARTEGRLPVVADADRLRQVLGNLLDNAVKYTPPGGTVTIAGKRVGAAVVVSVADTGEGISPDDIPRIFDRLYRADKSRSRRGLGLGLSLVRAVLFAHGGAIKVGKRARRRQPLHLHPAGGRRGRPGRLLIRAGGRRPDGENRCHGRRPGACWPQAPAQGRRFRREDNPSPGPIMHENDQGVASPFFFTKQALFDVRRKLWGYEIQGGSDACAALPCFTDQEQVAGSLASSSYMGVQHAVERGKKVVAPFDEDGLLAKAPYALPPAHGVVKVVGPLTRPALVLDAAPAVAPRRLRSGRGRRAGDAVRSLGSGRAGRHVVLRRRRGGDAPGFPGPGPGPQGGPARRPGAGARAVRGLQGRRVHPVPGALFQGTRDHRRAQAHLPPDEPVAAAAAHRGRGPGYGTPWPRPSPPTCP